MPLNISTDRSQTVVAPESLAVGTVIKVWGSVPYAFRIALNTLTIPAANVLHFASVTGAAVGQSVTGTNIPGSTTATAVNTTANTVTISQNVTSTGVASGATINFGAVIHTASDTPSGKTLVLVSLTGLTVGMTVTGTNIAANSTIASINTGATSITLNNAVSADVPSNTTLTFAVPSGIATNAATTTASVAALGLQVTTVRPDGLLGNGYENVVGALVYNRTKTSFTTLARAVAKGWALVPMDNIVPAAPVYV